MHIFITKHLIKTFFFLRGDILDLVTDPSKVTKKVSTSCFCACTNDKFPPPRSVAPQVLAIAASGPSLPALLLPAAGGCQPRCLPTRVGDREVSDTQVQGDGRAWGQIEMV